MNADSIVTAVFRALSQAKFEFLVVGSFSSNFYGNPRSTADLDIVIELNSGQSIGALSSLLAAPFQFVPQQSFELITGTRRFEIEVRDSAFKIELFVLSKDEHDVARFGRRVRVTLGDVEVFLPTVEDVIITKLRWGRSKDIEDVTGILAIRPMLDLEYLSKWCRSHGTMCVFEKLRAEIE